MTTPEDRLRELLRSEAEGVVPAGDGLARIQARVARRRQARRWLLPSAAVATAAAAATLVLVVPDARDTQTLTPATSTPTAQTPPSPRPTASPSPSAPPVPGTWNGPAYWPFASQAAVDALPSPVAQWATDPVEVVTRLVRDVLPLEGVTARQTCASCDVVSLRVGSEEVGQAQLGRLDWDGTRVYTVVGIEADGLTITAPRAGTAVSSPTSVAGRVAGVHENVDVRLLAQDGGQVAQAGAPAGAEVPWSASLSWSADDWTTGAVLGVTRSDRDGSVRRIVLVPVARATGATAGAFAALVDGHAALFDPTDGTQLRQLTYPPQGMQDTELAWGGSTLAWVREPTATRCTSSLNRLDAGKASTVAEQAGISYTTPRLSPSGALLGWVEIVCDGGAETVVVSGGGAPDRRLAGPSGSATRLLDVREDGTLLLLTNDRDATGPGTIGVLPAGSTSLDGLAALDVAPGCYLASGAAFVGYDAVTYETCGEDVRLVRFTSAGERVSVGASTKGEPPQSVSSRGDQLVVEQFGGDHYGAIAVVEDGRTRTLITNAGEQCSSIGTNKGCVRAPSW
jgi:hypothetical protein